MSAFESFWMYNLGGCERYVLTHLCADWRLEGEWLSGGRDLCEGLRSYLRPRQARRDA